MLLKRPLWLWCTERTGGPKVEAVKLVRGVVGIQGGVLGAVDSGGYSRKRMEGLEPYF